METVLSVVLFVAIQVAGNEPAQKAYPIQDTNIVSALAKCDAMVKGLREQAIEQLKKKEGSYQASCVLVSEPGNPV